MIGLITFMAIVVLVYAFVMACWQVGKVIMYLLMLIYSLIQLGWVWATTRDQPRGPQS